VLDARRVHELRRVPERAGEILEAGDDTVVITHVDGALDDAVAAEAFPERRRPARREIDDAAAKRGIELEQMLGDGTPDPARGADDDGDLDQRSASRTRPAEAEASAAEPASNGLMSIS
jgi:hypothetical protein